MEDYHQHPPIEPITQKGAEELLARPILPPLVRQLALTVIGLNKELDRRQSWARSQRER